MSNLASGSASGNDFANSVQGRSANHAAHDAGAEVNTDFIS